MKKTKNIIQSAEHFLQIVQENGFVQGDIWTNSFALKHGNTILVVNKHNERTGSRWKTGKQVGYQIRRPYEILGRNDRATEGQITIVFGKAIVEDVIAKMLDMVVRYEKYVEDRIESKKSIDTALAFLKEKSAQYNSINISGLNNKGFFYVPQPDGNELDVEFCNLKVSMIYYSYIAKAFILTGYSVPYEYRVEKIESYDTSFVDIAKIEKSLEYLKRVQVLIDKLNAQN